MKLSSCWSSHVRTVYEANAGHHLPAESCWFGISLGYRKLKGAGQLHGRKPGLYTANIA